MSAVDVLGAMDDAADDLDNLRMHSATLRTARDAVRELIEAASECLSDDDPFRARREARLRAALAKVQP